MQNTRNTTGDPALTEPALLTDVPDFREGPYGTNHEPKISAATKLDE